MKRAKVNPTFDNFTILSPKQVTFSCYLKMFRRQHNFSQKQMADLCTLYGKPYGIKLTQNDISRYECMKNIPRTNKFKTMMITMDLEPSML